MNSCDEHDGCIVVFDEKECPICTLEKDINEIAQANCDLQSEVDDLEKG